MTFTAFSQADTLRLFYNRVRSANLAERAEPSSVEARALSFLMYGSGLAGMHRLSASYHARALAVADQADAMVARAEVLLNRGVLLATIGSWDQALQELSASRQAYEALGEQHGIRQVIGVENFVNVHRCRLNEARKLCSQLRRLAEDADDAVHQSWAGLSLALQSVLLGGYEDAVAACEDLRPVVERSAEVPSMLNRLGILALASWRVGRLDVTGRHLEEAAALVAKVSPLATVHAYDPFWMLAEVAMAILGRQGHGRGAPRRDGCRQGSRYGDPPPPQTGRTPHRSPAPWHWWSEVISLGAPARRRGRSRCGGVPWPTPKTCRCHTS